MTKAAMQEAFEAWARTLGYLDFEFMPEHGGYYTLGNVQKMWLGYSKALSEQQPAATVPPKEKIAPVQGYTPGIPWSIHLEAYEAYSKKWSPQPAMIDLEGHNCRGGFSVGELDEFVPGWRDRISEIGRLRAEVIRLQNLLAASPIPPHPLQPLSDLTAALLDDDAVHSSTHAGAQGPPLAEPVVAFDKGPWTGKIEDPYKAFVESDDFTHDVRLYVNGDFESDEQRLAYAQGIAKRLNESYDSSPANVSPASRSDGMDKQKCAVCNGTGAVDDGELTCSEGGIPYENGPIKCMKHCPACSGRAASVGEPAQLLTEAEIEEAVYRPHDTFVGYEQRIQRAVLEKNIGRDLSRIEGEQG